MILCLTWIGNKRNEWTWMQNIVIYIHEWDGLFLSKPYTQVHLLFSFILHLLSVNHQVEVLKWLQVKMSSSSSIPSSSLSSCSPSSWSSWRETQVERLSSQYKLSKGLFVNQASTKASIYLCLCLSCCFPGFVEKLRDSTLIDAFRVWKYGNELGFCVYDSIRWNCRDRVDLSFSYFSCVSDSGRKGNGFESISRITEPEFCSCSSRGRLTTWRGRPTMKG
jgi:hypothetical protein